MKGLTRNEIFVVVDPFTEHGLWMVAITPACQIIDVTLIGEYEDDYHLQHDDYIDNVYFDR